MDKKGLVLKVDKKTSHLITSDGNLVSVKNQGIPPRVGQVYSGTPHKNHRYIKFIVAAFVLLLCISGAVIFYITHVPYASVVIEARACIQIKTNRKNIVIKSEGINNSGRIILNKVDLDGQPLDNALIAIIDEAKKEKLIDKNFIDSNSKITLYLGEGSKGIPEIDNFEQYVANNDLGLLINNNGTLIINPKKKIINQGNNP